MNSNEAFTRAALFERCAKYEKFKYIDITNTDSETIKDLLNREHMLHLKTLPILFSKLIVQYGLQMVVAKFPTASKYIEPQNLRICVEDDELSILMENQSKLKPNLYVIVIKNIIVGIVGSSIDSFTSTLLDKHQNKSQKDPNTNTVGSENIQKIKLNSINSKIVTNTPKEYSNFLSDNSTRSSSRNSIGSRTPDSGKPQSPPMLNHTTMYKSNGLPENNIHERLNKAQELRKLKRNESIDSNRSDLSSTAIPKKSLLETLQSLESNDCKIDILEDLMIVPPSPQPKPTTAQQQSPQPLAISQENTNKTLENVNKSGIASVLEQPQQQSKPQQSTIMPQKQFDNSNNNSDNDVDDDDDDEDEDEEMEDHNNNDYDYSNGDDNESIVEMPKTDDVTKVVYDYKAGYDYDEESIVNDSDVESLTIAVEKDEKFKASDLKVSQIKTNVPNFKDFISQKKQNDGFYLSDNENDDNDDDDTASVSARSEVQRQESNNNSQDSFTFKAKPNTSTHNFTLDDD